MALRAKGNVEIRQVDWQKTWSQRDGWRTIFTYEGRWGDIDAAKTNAAYTAGALTTDINRNPGGRGTLIVTFANADGATQEDLLSSAWTLEPQEIEREIHRHPNYQPLAAIEAGYLERILSAVDIYRSKVAAGIEAQTTDKDLEFVLSSYITLKGTAAQQLKAVDLAALKLYGWDTFTEAKYTLRNTRTVPRGTSLTAEFANTAQMWSNNNIVTTINATDADKTERSIIGNIQTNFSGSFWLKHAPRIDEISPARYQIVIEWSNYADGEFSTILTPKYE